MMRALLVALVLSIAGFTAQTAQAAVPRAFQNLAPAASAAIDAPQVGPVIAAKVAAMDDGSEATAIGDGDGRLSSAVEIALLLTVLSLLPAVLITLTSFTRIVIVLSFVRRAGADPAGFRVPPPPPPFPGSPPERGGSFSWVYWWPSWLSVLFR